MNIADLLHERAESPDRDRIGLILGDGRRWTYGELDTLADAVANELAERGLGVGDRIATYLPNSVELVAVLFGAWKLGVTVATVNSAYQSADLAHAVDLAEPRLLLTGEGTALGSVEIRQVEVHDLRTPDDVFARALGRAEIGTEKVEIADLDASAESVIIFTGGSTGRPKAVARTHAGELESLLGLAQNSKGGKPGPYPVAPPSVPPNLILLPMAHVGGQKSLLFSLLVGRTALLVRRFDAALLADLVRRYGITNLTLMPTMMHDLLEYDGGLDLSTVRSVLSTGQELRPALRSRFEKRYNIPILSNYGSTEVGTIASWSARDVKEGRWKPGSVGRVLPGVEVKILGDGGADQQIGEVGEICARTGMARRYVGEQGADDGLLKDGWVHTGDTGWIDADGVLFLVGRTREMIKCGGFQVWPGELEETILAMPGVSDVAVVSKPDPRLGEIPVAFVVKREDGLPTADDVLKYCRSRVAHYKAVREVHFVGELPRTDVGKLARNELANLLKVHG